jgi:NTE family protein
MTAHCGSEGSGERNTAAAQRRVPRVNLHSGITLALGGGFSRGFAHLGVLEVLQQERLPISAIVGTSIGALLGAAYADGIAIRDLCELGRQVRVRDFLRFHPAKAGTPRKDRIGLFVQEWFAAETVQDLAIPTAIVTTDLDTGAPYLFTSGPLELALRASCAFPGLMKPVAYEGRLLADGCITAPVPTAIAARMFGGAVLAVSVGSNTAKSSPSKNAGRECDAKLRPSRRGGSELSCSRHADIFLEPRVQHLDWSDFSCVDEAFAAGAEAARHALPALRALFERQSRQAPPLVSSPSAERGLAR